MKAGKTCHADSLRPAFLLIGNLGRADLRLDARPRFEAHLVGLGACFGPDRGEM